MNIVHRPKKSARPPVPRLVCAPNGTWRFGIGFLGMHTPCANRTGSATDIKIDSAGKFKFEKPLQPMIMTDNKGIKKEYQKGKLMYRMVAKHVLNELKLYWHQSGHWQSTLVVLKSSLVGSSGKIDAC